MKSRFWYQIIMYSFLFFVITTLFVQKNKTAPFDEFVISWVSSIQHPILTSMLIAITNIGSFLGTVIVWAIIVYVILSRKWYHEAIIVTFVTFSTPIVNIIIKHLFSRPRPDVNLLIEISGYSYPSGHTMYATSLYGITLILFWKRCKHAWQRILLLSITLIMIISIAFSRIYLGVHYPSDTIGGFFLSLLIISLTLYIYLLIQERAEQNSVE